jgi:serine O-acetyltransferase
MPSKVKRLLAVINYFRTLPVYLCVLCSRQKNLIKMDVARWNEIDQVEFNMFESINWYMTYKKEFRNLLMHRLKNPSRTVLSMMHFVIARILWKPMDSLYIYTEDIGGGLYIQHGFATIITAKKIGENCRIYQQVTIGYKNGTSPPVLEDNVSVTCGAKVLGDITMHKGSLAAAGAVVVKDVPENAIVAGVPAKVIGYKDEINLGFQG